MTDSLETQKTYCRTCGEEVRPDAKICPKCGVEQAQVALIQPVLKTPSTQKTYCRACGAEIRPDARICPKCGVEQVQPALKNPGLAAIASFFFAGLGQIYNGEIGKGVLLMIVQLVNVMLFFVVIGFITYPITWIYGMWDAYKTAEKINMQTK